MGHRQTVCKSFEFVAQHGEVKDGPEAPLYHFDWHDLDW
jgi:hypothetical protein